MTGKTQLEAMETEVNAELKARAKAENSPLELITDGVVDIDRYLASSPKMLWILKESWVGSPSVTQYLIPKLIADGRIFSSPTYRKMAYVTFSALNGMIPFVDIVSNQRDRIADSLKSIAYINVNKFTSGTISNPKDIASAYRRNRELLKNQIATINPDIVIAGNILHLFYEEFGFSYQDLTSAGSADFCRRNGRLYINAYHPSYWRCKEATYVNDLVAIIKEHRAAGNCAPYIVPAETTSIEM